MGRVHRATSKSKSINLVVYLSGTVEEKVFETVKNRMDNINALNDGDLAETEVFKNV